MLYRIKKANKILIKIIKRNIKNKTKEVIVKLYKRKIDHI